MLIKSWPDWFVWLYRIIKISKTSWFYFMAFQLNVQDLNVDTIKAVAETNVRGGGEGLI